MKEKLGQVIEATVLLILVYLVVTNAFGVTSLIRATGQFYIGAVEALQGR